MTIAIGILTNDGAVVAADTEQNYGYDIKGTDGKILGLQRPAQIQNMPPLSLGISGSGYTNYIKSARMDIMGLISSQYPPKNPKAIIEEYIGKFYADHVFPFYQHDKSVEFDLLVCLRINGSSSGFVTDKTSAHYMIKFGAVGTGEPYATMLLNNLWDHRMDTSSAVLLAAYVITCVKETITGCGKRTQIGAITDGKFTIIPDELVKELDDFNEHHASLREAAFKWMIGIGDQPLTSVSAVMKSKRRESDKIIQSIKATISETSQA